MKFADHILRTYWFIDDYLYNSGKDNKFTNISKDIDLKNIVSDININDYSFIFELINKLKYLGKYPSKREYSYLITVRDWKHSGIYGANKYQGDWDPCWRWVYNYEDNWKKEEYAIKFSICRKSQHKDWIDKYKNHESLELWFVIDEKLYKYLESIIPEAFNKNFIIKK